LLLCNCLLGIQPDRRRQGARDSGPDRAGRRGRATYGSPVSAPSNRQWDVPPSRKRKRACTVDRSVRSLSSSPVWFPGFPPTGYGGDRVDRLAARRRARRGPGTTSRLFASGDSRTKAKLASVYEVAPQRADRPPRRSRCGPRTLVFRPAADEFDVVNDHSGPPASRDRRRAVRTPVVHNGARPAALASPVSSTS